MRLSRTALLALVAAAVGQGLYYYPRMPEVMASHFDASGTPDGFQTRGVFYAFVVGTTLLSVGIFVLMRPLLRWIPKEWVNLPNRDYWLAEERWEEACERLSSEMEWFGAATMILLLVVLQWVFEANLGVSRELDSGSMWWALGLYSLFTTVWLVRLVRGFRRPACA